ncbi:MAG: hypothetical protein ABEJ40_07115 [Haloarculaceae archaeon]
MCPRTTRRQVLWLAGAACGLLPAEAATGLTGDGPASPSSELSRSVAASRRPNALPASRAATDRASAREPLDVAWRRTYGGEGETLLNDATAGTGGALLVGRTDSAGVREWGAWLRAVDGAGGRRWRRVLDDGEFSSAAAAVPAADGGYLVVGSQRRTRDDQYTAWARTVGADGTVAWKRTYGEDGEAVLTTVARVGDGYRLAGRFRSGGSDDGWLLAVDAGGAPLWQRTYGGDGDRTFRDCVATGPAAVGDGDGTPTSEPTDAGTAMATDTGTPTATDTGTPTGTVSGARSDTAAGTEGEPDRPGRGLLLAGTTTAVSGGLGARLVRVDRQGDVQWARTYAGGGFSLADAVVRVGDGYVFAGRTVSSGPQRRDVWLVAVGPDGGVRWRRTHGGEADDWATDLVRTPAGFLVAGTSAAGTADSEDALVLSVDDAGGYRWHRFDGGPGRDRGRTVLPTPDGGYLVAGRYGSAAPDRTEAWLTKLVEPTPTPTPARTPTDPPTPDPTPPPADGTETPTLDRIDMSEARGTQTTSGGGPGLGVPAALAALGAGTWAWLRGRDGDEES